MGFFKIVAFSVLAWITTIIFKCTPERWTSWERVKCETLYRLGMPLIALNPTASVDGTLPYCDADKLLPVENPPPLLELYVSEDPEAAGPGYIDEKTAINTLLQASINRDTIVIWKNFTKGKLDQYKDKSFVQENFNDDNYIFATNYSNYRFVELGLQSALTKMSEYYLGFSYTLLNRNPSIWRDVNSALNSYGPELQSIIPVNNSKHHAFLYEGKRYRTGFHQAPVGDWFLQIANTKKWRFVHPKYSPYTRVLTLDGISLMAEWDFIPEKTRVPVQDVYTEPGDLMFFPPHWWHEVHNEYDDFGFAFGFRPKRDVIGAPLEVLFPFFAKPGELGHRMLFLFSLGYQAISKIGSITTNNDNSGLKSRVVGFCMFLDKIHPYLPNWSWDKYAPPGTTPGCHGEEDSISTVAAAAATSAGMENSGSAPVVSESQGEL